MVDLQQIVTAITKALPGLHPTKISKIETSYGHACWHIETNKSSYLLKIPVRRTSPHDFNNEIRAQQLMTQYGIPSPALIAISPSSNSLGMTFFIQEWLPGEDGARAYPCLSTTQAQTFAQDFGRNVALMHGIPGTTFSEDVLGDHTYSSWRDLCCARLSRLIQDNARVAILPHSVITTIDKRCQALLELEVNVEPRFTHRDLYLPNTLVNNGRFYALLDFESARFYDPLWDFVKLDAWAFRRHPALRTPFLDGYTSISPWQENMAQRIFLYQAIEYLAAFPYFSERFPNQTMLGKFHTLMTEWLQSSPEYIADWRTRS